MEKKSGDNRVVAFIPLRGGSRSIPLKNIKEIAGKPLALWTIEAALASPRIHRVVVSTDSDEIRETLTSISNEKLEVIDRSEATATDDASTESVMLEFANAYDDFEYIILIQATSPLISSEMLTEGVDSFFSSDCDSMLSATRQKRFIWKEEDGAVVPINYEPTDRPRRQEFDGFLAENGAFYMISRKALLEHGCRLCGKIHAYEMPEETYYELDEPHDWDVVEQLLARRKTGVVPEKKAAVKMVIFDVDGVFTDGSVYTDADGNETVRFSRIDGKGIELLRNAGYEIAVISAEESEIVRKRMEKLQIKEVHLGVQDKLGTYEVLKQKYGRSDQEVCFCGDDVQDIPVLKRVGFSAAPANARSSVKRVCDFVSKTSGGDGFVRDVCEKLLE